MSENSPVARMIPVAKHPGIFRKGNRYVVTWRYRGRQRKRSFRTLTEATDFKAATITGDAAPTSSVALVAYASAWVDGYTGRTSATGLRIGEALALAWSDLARADDGRPVLTVRISKTAAGERVVPLSPETLRLLTRRRAQEDYDADAQPIFSSRFGTPLDAHNWRQRVFKPAAARAGVPWATPHSLRHGMASLMAERGYSPAQIAAHLGHADGGVLALRTYIRTQAIEAPQFVDVALRG